MKHIMVITGGIGSGKSEVCKILSRLGYTDQYDADSRVKGLYVSSPVLVDKLEEMLGINLRGVDGEFKPSLLAAGIFDDRDALEKVESLVFPALMDDFTRFAEKAITDIVVFESATILEKQYFENFGDIVILADAPIPVRLDRAMKRDSADEKAIRLRMNNQEMMNWFSTNGVRATGQDSPWYDSSKRVDYVIDTDCSLEELENRVTNAINIIKTKML